MAVKIRLARFGKKKKPFYRVVVTNETSPRDGRFIEVLGTYDPCCDPVKISLDKEKAVSWLKKGAQPTQAADQLLRKEGVFKG
jgi:small subunit ribosomal protein S16